MAGYPAHLSRRLRLADGRRLLLRPARDADAAAASELHDFAPSYAELDYQHRFGMVCEAEDGSLAGEARYVAQPQGRGCDFAVAVAPGWRRAGVAALLMDALTGAARARGFQTMEGIVLRDNAAMLALAGRLGFERAAIAGEPALLRVTLRL